MLAVCSNKAKCHCTHTCVCCNCITQSMAKLMKNKKEKREREKNIENNKYVLEARMKKRATLHDIQTDIL